MLPISTYTGGLVQTNAFLFTLPGGTLLVDAPEGVNEWLEEAGVHVDALFLTHQHFDHVQDAAVVKERHGCKIHAWTAFDRQLTLERLFGAVTGSPIYVPEYEVDVTLKEETELQLLGEGWQLLHVPGHSADSLCLYLKHASLLFGGDVLFFDGIGRTDFPGGSFARLAAGIHEKLWPLPAETQVLPGHGPGTTIGREKVQNPAVSATAD